MTYSNVFSGIHDTLLTEFTHPGAVLVLQNTPPQDADLMLLVSIVPAVANRAAIGTGGTSKVTGNIVASAYAREKQDGPGPALALADHLVSLFPSGREILYGGTLIVFESPYIAGSGRSDGNGYFQVPVRCPWFTYMNL